MALLRKLGDEGGGKWIVRGKDHGKPVRVKIRPIPSSVNREIRRGVLGNVKSRKAGNRSVAENLEQLEDLVVARAAFALQEVENYAIELADAAAVAMYGPLLKVEVKPGEEVYLDGKCTEEVKERLFSDYPAEASWVAEQAEKLTRVEAEEEEEATESF